jgi:peptidyl-tRNA hydrolase, PTH1 family
MGMMALDFFALKLGLSWSYTPAMKGWICQHTLHSQAIGMETKDWSTDLLLFKPKGFMNSSGIHVKKLVKEYSSSQFVVLHDDLERKLGKVTIKNGGSANGHNGIRSIISELKTNNFQRIRIGIGRPILKEQVAEYVLNEFSRAETAIIESETYPLVYKQLIALSHQ